MKKDKDLKKIMTTLIAVFFLLSTVSACAKDQSKPQINYTAPAISEKNLDGQLVSLSDYKDKIVVINFWGIWCPYCVKEMPAFSKAAQENPNVIFLMINVSNNMNHEDITDIKKFLTSQNLSFDHILLNTKTASVYNVRAFPTTLIIGKDGKISYTMSGQMSYDKLISLIQQADK